MKKVWKSNSWVLRIEYFVQKWGFRSCFGRFYYLISWIVQNSFRKSKGGLQILFKNMEKQTPSSGLLKSALLSSLKSRQKKLVVCDDIISSHFGYAPTVSSDSKVNSFGGKPLGKILTNLVELCNCDAARSNLACITLPNQNINLISTLGWILKSILALNLVSDLYLNWFKF